jgi:hypothetical protein
MKNQIIVLAGSRQQFEDYLDKNGLTDSEAVYGYDARSVYGIKASRVEVIGTFWERNDASKLKELADSRVIK